jgi:Transcription factor WhiB
VGEAVPAEPHDPGLVDGGTRRRHHHRFHRLAPGVVGDSDGGGVGDGGMGEEHVLHLGRIDVLPPGDDHVGLSVREVEVPVLVHVAHVTQRSPTCFVGDGRRPVNPMGSQEPAPAVDWWDLAACRGRLSLFFGDDRFSQELAISICRRECSVRRECEAETRIVETSTRKRFGVRAGFTATERMDRGLDLPQ